jgi:predicted translin family RNA/ssDNA-binding protein
MPAAFELTELKKGHFLHFLSLRGTLPGCSLLQLRRHVHCQSESVLHLVRAKKKKKKTRVETFDFQKEFLDYCISDVDILRRCCAQFKSILYALVRVDPFQESITFASTAN